MAPLNTFLSELKLPDGSITILKNSAFHFIRYLLFLVIFIFLISSLNQCCKDKISQPGEAFTVPLISSWKTTYNVPTQNFKFGYDIEAGFDLDQDGYREFAAFDTANNKLVIFENIGDDNFEYRWAYEFADSSLNSKNLSVTTGDLNSDGFKEFIVIADLVNQPGILIWQHEISSGAFLPEFPSAEFDPLRDNEGRILPSNESLVQDFDNDQQDELLILYNGNKKFLMIVGSLEPGPWDSIFPSSFNIEYVDSLQEPEPSGIGILKTAGVGVGDIDQNGSKEIVIVCEGIKAPIRLYSYKNGFYQFVKSWQNKDFPADYIGSSANIPIADFNKDGKLEAYLLSNPNIVVSPTTAAPATSQIWVVELDTNLTNAFDSKNFIPIVTLDSTKLRGGVVGDGDRDGKPDIYALGIDNGTLYQIEFTSNRDSTITNKYNYVPYKIYHEKSIRTSLPTNISNVLDLDRDGRNEILIVRGKRFFGIPMRNPSLPATSDNSGAFVLEKSGIVAPSHLVSQKTANGEVKLSWKDNAENETNFKIVLDDGIPPDSLINDQIGKDVRHFFHTTPPDYNEDLEYRAIAFNSDTHQESDKSNGIQIPTISEDELCVQHANGLVIGNLGGSGSGWSDLVCTTPSGIEQDFIYDGYLLLWRKPVTAGAVSKINYGDSVGHFKPYLNTKIGLTKYSTYEKTHALEEPYKSVLLQTNDEELIIAQITIHKLGSKWVLSWWAVKNVSTSSSSLWVKLALHLDVDTGGELSRHDYGKKNEDLKMIYQESYDSQKTVGIAHIINNPDITDINLGNLAKAQTNSFNSFNAQNLLDNANADLPPYFDLVTGEATDIEMTLVSDLGTIEKDKFRMVIFAIMVADNPEELNNITQAKDFFLNDFLDNIPLDIDSFEANGCFLLTQEFLNSPGKLLTYTHNIPQPAKMKFEIFDIFGHSIKLLESSIFLHPGDKEIHWDGKNATGSLVSPGIYLYKFEVDLLE